MVNVSKEAKRKAWENAIALNQIDGQWEPDAEFKELMEKEINGQIIDDDIIKFLTDKYRGQPTKHTPRHEHVP